MLSNQFKFQSKHLINAIQKRTAIYKPEVFFEPVINKNELDNLPADDQRHFKKIRTLMSRESNALTYNHKIHKFTNMMMRDGRAMTARNVVDKTMFKIKLKQVEKVNKATTEEEKAKIEADPVKIMLKAFENCKPILKLTPVKKGGITYQVPVPMTEKEREFKSFKFILKACEDKPDTMRIYDRLSNELIDASNFAGKAIKTKVELHKLAETNRAYAHYRWL